MATATRARAQAQPQTSMDVDGRRVRVERARAAAKRLVKVEAALQDALARLPGLAREVTEIRAELDEVLANPTEEE